MTKKEPHIEDVLSMEEMLDGDLLLCAQRHIHKALRYLEQYKKIQPNDNILTECIYGMYEEIRFSTLFLDHYMGENND